MMLALEATSNKRPRNIREKRRETFTHTLAIFGKNVSCTKLQALDFRPEWQYCKLTVIKLNCNSIYQKQFCFFNCTIFNLILPFPVIISSDIN